jgi:hypothetical protein
MHMPREILELPRSRDPFGAFFLAALPALVARFAAFSFQAQRFCDAGIRLGVARVPPVLAFNTAAFADTGLPGLPAFVWRDASGRRRACMRFPSGSVLTCAATDQRRIFGRLLFI